MSEEEKEAIKELKHYGNMTSYYKEREYTDIQIEKYIDTVLNLIDKQQKQIEEKERQLKIKNEYLQLAHDIAFDYDGCNTVKSLKSLIDEIVELINKAYKNDDNSIIYIGGNSKKFNILHKEVENE